MLHLIFVCLSLTSFYAFERYKSLRRNVRLARETGLPYITVPVYTGTPLWYFCYKYILPVFGTLPKRWTDPWLDFLDPYWSWKLHHEPFARLGSDTIIIAAPGGLQFCTCDPKVIVEIAGRRDDFCKPVESYVYLDLFGPSLITREGKSWRAHQRILAPTFTERNTKLVWDESIAQTEQMLEAWRDSQSSARGCIADLREDTMTLPFHVINKAGFGVHLPWSSKKKSSDDLVGTTTGDLLAEGHSMTYREALHSTISHLFHIVIFPGWLLRTAPFAHARFLHTAHMETIRYLKELMVQKELALARDGSEASSSVGFDLMSALISTKVQNKRTAVKQDGPESSEDGEALTERAILANVFLMLIAGHETTASALLLTLVEMATDLCWQQEVQRDIDQIFGDRPRAGWRLQIDAPLLAESKVGATINEVLRMYPPANIIPKGTRAGSWQTIKTGPHGFTIPENSAVQFLAVSVHHNPKYWPSTSLSDDGENDLKDFKPQRWLLNAHVSSTSKSHNIDATSRQSEEARKEFLSSEAPSTLFRPQPGAYIPFSTGHRGCIGRRFAQVEMLAVIAVIFRDYSLELDVESFASDDVVETMTTEERRAVYEKARSDIRKTIREGFTHHLTMQLKGGHLAIRLVERRQERFFDAYR